MFEHDDSPPCRVYPMLARRPGWTVSEHPSGMLIWRSPSGRHYLRRPDRGGASPEQAGHARWAERSGAAVEAPAEVPPALWA
jgi:hypothetical protein